MTTSSRWHILRRRHPWWAAGLGAAAAGSAIGAALGIWTRYRIDAARPAASDHQRAPRPGQERPEPARAVPAAPSRGRPRPAVQSPAERPAPRTAAPADRTPPATADQAEQTKTGAPPPGSRRTSGRVRALVALAVVGWLVLGAFGGPFVARLSEVIENDSADFLPATSESVEVDEVASKALPVGNGISFLMVVERPTGLTSLDRTAIADLAADLPRTPVGGDTLQSYLSAPVGPPVFSPDRQAALITVTVDANRGGEIVAGHENAVSAIAAELRNQIDERLEQRRLVAHITGQGGIIADFSVAFGGIDSILLGVALAVVFAILLIVYRSPILPLAVLVTAVLGLTLAALVVYQLAKADIIDLDGQSQGIMFILVIGAATDYGLLLVSRYKEELHIRHSPAAAMRAAYRAVLGPIGASAATVILGLMCLLLASLGNTRGLGPVGSLGIAGALVAALSFLPAVLVLCGRRVFWPFIPQVDHVRTEIAGRREPLWGRIADLVGRRARLVWVLTAIALLAGAAFLPTFRDDGIKQTDLFLDRVDSVAGHDVLTAHFAAGSADPVLILAPAGQATGAAAVAQSVPGVVQVSRVLPPRRTDAETASVADRVLLRAVVEPAADTSQGRQLVSRLRIELDQVSPQVLVGGQAAFGVDLTAAENRDLRVIVPTILAVVFGVLALLLRSLIAPLLLLVANVLSFAATVGVSALVFNYVLKLPGAEPAVPMYAFVFLVALGIDYSIFLMTRVREESLRLGTRQGIVVGLAVTGVVITSAGVVLAATFSALVLIPILFLLQIAFMVGFGVLLDTIVVRSLLVPAIAYDIGPALWWPHPLARRRDQPAGDRL